MLDLKDITNIRQFVEREVDKISLGELQKTKLQKHVLTYKFRLIPLIYFAKSKHYNYVKVPRHLGKISYDVFPNQSYASLIAIQKFMIN